MDLHLRRRPLSLPCADVFASSTFRGALADPSLTGRPPPSAGNSFPPAAPTPRIERPFGGARRRQPRRSTQEQGGGRSEVCGSPTSPSSAPRLAGAPPLLTRLRRRVPPPPSRPPPPARRPGADHSEPELQLARVGEWGSSCSGFAPTASAPCSASAATTGGPCPSPPRRTEVAPAPPTAWGSWASRGASMADGGPCGSGGGADPSRRAPVAGAARVHLRGRARGVGTGGPAWMPSLLHPLPNAP
jgi:hypothetical protein